jgi:hypothetical protein
MKKLNALILSGIFIAGLTTQAVAQQETLPEIIVTAKTYKYLRAVDNKEMAPPVKLLERKAATYDVRNSEYYDDDYDTYSISFYLPNGYLLAVYDASGKLLSTVERYRNIALPLAVKTAVVNQYPNWGITKDVYLVTYNQDSGAEKIYKLVLQNGNKRLRVKVNEKGTLL